MISKKFFKQTRILDGGMGQELLARGMRPNSTLWSANAILDENGEVVDGDRNAVIETTDFWTFSRNAKSNDPNWTLVATNSLD